MRSTTTMMAAAWLVIHAGSLAAGSIGLPDGRILETIDFERHVHALLDRQGCNAGKCHGNRDGEGGFSLSLFAASPESDFLKIAHRSNGRHINVVDPDRSLFLQKATGNLEHGGGIRVVPGSWEYQLLREWIARGARRDTGGGQIKSVQVIPHDHIFQINDHLNLKVIAEFADGAKEDVTPFCDFRLPTKEDKKAVDPVRVSRSGAIVAVRPGDVSISAVYRGRVRVMRARVAVPVAKDFVYPKIPEVNFIDREVFGQLRPLNIVPSDLSSDEMFLRRVTIDLIGTLPTSAEVRAFSASKDSDKRIKKIDELLAHPLHAALLATRFCEMTDLIGESDGAKSPRNKATQMAHGWFRKRLHENMPYDKIVAGVLTATSREGRALDGWLKEKAALEKSDTGFGSDYRKRIAHMVHQFGRGDLVSRCKNEADLRSRRILYGSNHVQHFIERSKRIERLRKSDEQQFDALLDEVFLVALSRLPTPEVRKQANALIKREWPKDRPRVVENLVWWLISTSEFSMRH